MGLTSPAQQEALKVCGLSIHIHSQHLFGAAARCTGSFPASHCYFTHSVALTSTRSGCPPKQLRAFHCIVFNKYQQNVVFNLFIFVNPSFETNLLNWKKNRCPWYIKLVLGNIWPPLKVWVRKKNRFDCYQSFTKMCHPADRPSADACNCSHLQYFFPHAESAVGARSCGACIPPASAHL